MARNQHAILVEGFEMLQSAFTSSIDLFPLHVTFKNPKIYLLLVAHCRGRCVLPVDLKRACDVNTTVIVSISQLRKLKHQEFKKLNHNGDKWQTVGPDQNIFAGVRAFGLNPCVFQNRLVTFWCEIIARQLDGHGPLVAFSSQRDSFLAFCRVLSKMN